MILSDFDLKSMIDSKRLVVAPFKADTVRENGLDLRLSNELARHKEFPAGFVLDPKNGEHVEGTYELLKAPAEMVVRPREQVLLSTLERIEVPDDLMGFVELRSTWARHGLSMPPTIIDAGFKGTVTLEVLNSAPYAIRLAPEIRFAHIIFSKVLNKVENPYKGHYHGQEGIKLPKKLD